MFSFYYHDQRLWIYLSIHICSTPLYLLPILIFTKSNTNVHKIVFNFTLVTAFLCSFTFAFGFDTPDIFHNEGTGAVFYLYHSYTWHTLLVLLFAYFVIFGFERMYSKFHWQVVIFILLVNVCIFLYAEILRGAGIKANWLNWILYNHDMEPIFSWCNKNPYLTNFVLFILTLSIYEGVYFAYFYIEKAIRKYSAKKHHLRINR